MVTIGIQVDIMPTPMPAWDGVGYVPTYALPTYHTGDVNAAQESAELLEVWLRRHRPDGD